MKEGNMKYILVVLLLLSTPVYARDFKLPRVNSTDSMSATFFNGIMSKIESTQNAPIISDLTGSWSCNSYVNQAILRDGEFNTNSWLGSSDGLMMEINSTLVFTSTTLSATISNPFSPVSPDTNTPLSTPYQLKDGYLYVAVNKNTDGSPQWVVLQYKVSWSGDGDILLVPNGPQTVQYAANISCSRPSQPPVAPTGLTSSVTGKSVTLTWTDNSSGEASFNIYRKTTSDDSFTKVGITNSGVTVYTETVSDKGTYQYMIKALNDTGESDMTNVVLVTIK